MHRHMCRRQPSISTIPNASMQIALSILLGASGMPAHSADSVRTIGMNHVGAAWAASLCFCAACAAAVKWDIAAAKQAAANKPHDAATSVLLPRTAWRQS